MDPDRNVKPPPCADVRCYCSRPCSDCFKCALLKHPHHKYAGIYYGTVSRLPLTHCHIVTTVPPAFLYIVRGGFHSLLRSSGDSLCLVVSSMSHIKAERRDLDQLSDKVKESLRLIEDLKFFLATAPANWQENQVIRRYYLNLDEGFVSCVFWNNLYFITGTDIVRCIVYKFTHFGRKIVDRKKFEEGIFSDLRNLKRDSDAVLEAPRSDFLKFLYKNSCLRTQKKQKVFFWFNVPHDRLMADALERDLKKEKLGQQPTTVAEREPALSFTYNESVLLELDLNRQIAPEVVSTEPVSAKDDHEPAYKSSAAALHDEVNELQLAVASYVRDGPRNADEDDFPLDYFPPDNYMAQAPTDYIPLDRAQPGYSVAFDDLVRSYNFSTPQLARASSPHNKDEYLIEHTQLVRPSKFYPSDLLPAKQVVYGAPVAAGDIDTYGYPMQPLTSGIQPHFYEQMPAQMPFQPYMVPVPESFVYNPYGEPDPWGPPFQPYSTLPVYKDPSEHMFQGSYDQPSVAMHPSFHQVSEKQQAASNSMMRKKRELLGRRGGVRKPSVTPKVRFFTANADLPRLQDSDQFIPTPDASLNAE